MHARVEPPPGPSGECRRHIEPDLDERRLRVSVHAATTRAFVNGHRQGGRMGATKSLTRDLIVGFAAVCTALWCMAPSSVGASDGDFDYAVERITIDGNLWGPHDGTPDAVEESFNENWQISPFG